MTRAVPSQIDHYLTANLPRQDFYNAAELQQKVGVIAGFVDLYYDLPPELMNLSPGDYAALVAAMATIKLSMDRYRGGALYDELVPIGAALPKAWSLIRQLPDSFPTTRHDLTFVSDVPLRDMIGADIDAVSVDLQSGEWKGATVLAGSCSEALLLYGIQEWERRNAGAITGAVGALTWPGRPPNGADPTHQSWNLFGYTAVAHALNLITTATKNELDTARDYRNLIHPAKAIRERVACDRGTAYVSAGALDHVIRDLRARL